MEAIFLEEIIQLGAVGILIVYLISRINTLENQHKLEREEWRIQAKSQHDDLVKLSSDTHSLLSELKIMISTK